MQPRPDMTDTTMRLETEEAAGCSAGTGNAVWWSLLSELIAAADADDQDGCRHLVHQVLVSPLARHRPATPSACAVTLRAALHSLDLDLDDHQAAYSIALHALQRLETATNKT